jgi:hypothetical protein
VGALLADFKCADVGAWDTKHKHAVYIVHEEQTPAIEVAAARIRDWLLARTELDGQQVRLHSHCCDSRRP